MDKKDFIKPFDLEKAKAGAPIQCRDGTPAKFIAYCPDVAPDAQPVVALVNRKLMTFGSSGSAIGNSYGTGYSMDLVMAPNKYTGWLNFYEDGGPALSPTKELAEELAEERADKTAGPGRIACIKVEFTEGDGL